MAACSPEEELLNEWLPAEEEDDDADPSAADPALAAAGVGPEELAACASVLRRLAAARHGIDWSSPSLRDFRKALAPHLGEAAARLPQKDKLDAEERRKFERKQKREHRQRQLDADQRWRENAQLRASRLTQLEALTAPPDEEGGWRDLPRIPDGPVPDEPASPSSAPLPISDGRDASGGGGAAPARDAFAEPGAAADDEEEEARYSRQQACYICKARFSERHHFYSHLCPPCASLNFAKRQQAANLEGRVCLVTGARVKIGFAVAVKLLRMGARVIATTRFPADAAKRYHAEADSADWAGRLEIRGVDFRFLGAVEAFCEDLTCRESHLDVLINNACQTIRRPAAYYQHLLEGEARAGGQPSLAAVPTPGASALGLEQQLIPSDGNARSQIQPAASGSAGLSQMKVLQEDGMTASEAQLVLPQGERDAHGQQLDTRSSNSWLLKLGEVATPEAVEVFCINTLTPFILNSRLRPLMERSPHADRYVVNVSAMEGKFYRYKQPTHPHTNMAKAALNMMTRTSAEDLAKSSGIFMNSVDTGWINDENPLPTAQRIAQEHGFQTPIDEVDAAARILDPVIVGIKDSGQARMFGCFLKDYAPTEW